MSIQICGLLDVWICSDWSYDRFVIRFKAETYDAFVSPFDGRNINPLDIMGRSNATVVSLVPLTIYASIFVFPVLNALCDISFTLTSIMFATLAGAFKVLIDQEGAKFDDVCISYNSKFIF